MAEGETPFSRAVAQYIDQLDLMLALLCQKDVPTLLGGQQLTFPQADSNVD